MKTMTKGDFMSLVQQGGEWLGGPDLAREVAFHVPDSENIVGWLWLERRKAESWSSRKERTGRLAILSERHFLIVQMTVGEDSVRLSVESAPLGRLRSLKTYSHGEGKGGGFTLDFAGPVFEHTGNYGGSEIHHHVDKDWPGVDIGAFLAALAGVRR